MTDNELLLQKSETFSFCCLKPPRIGPSSPTTLSPDQREVTGSAEATESGCWPVRMGPSGHLTETPGRPPRSWGWIKDRRRGSGGRQKPGPGARLEPPLGEAFPPSPRCAPSAVSPQTCHPRRLGFLPCGMTPDLQACGLHLPSRTI